MLDRSIERCGYDSIVRSSLAAAALAVVAAVPVSAAIAQSAQRDGIGEILKRTPETGTQVAQSKQPPTATPAPQAPAAAPQPPAAGAIPTRARGI